MFGVINNILRLTRSAVQFLSDRSKLSSVAKTFLIRLAMLGVTFGTGIIVARTLAPVGRGEQAAITLWPIFVAGLATFGIPTSLNYQSSKNPLDSKRFLAASIAVVTILGSCCAGIAVAFMPSLMHDYSNELIMNARYLMVFTPQCLLVYVLRAHLEARGEYLRSILGQLVPTVFVLICLVFLRLAHTLTPSTAALAYYGPSAVQTLWLFWRIRSQILFDLSCFAADVRMVLLYGLRCYGTDIINTLSLQADLAIIIAFVSPTALGLYTVSLTVARLLNIVQQSIVSVLFPHASSLEADQALAIVGRAARLSLALSIAFGLILVGTVPILLPLVYGKTFLAAITIVPILIAEAVVAGAATILSLSFSACGRPAVVTYIQGVWLVCVLALLLILVPQLHVSGAAFALFGGAIIRLVLVMLAYRFVLESDVPNLILNRLDVKYVVDRFLPSGSIKIEHSKGQTISV